MSAAPTPTSHPVTYMQAPNVTPDEVAAVLTRVYDILFRDQAGDVYRPYLVPSAPPNHLSCVGPQVERVAS